MNRKLMLEAMALLTPGQRDLIRRAYYEAMTTAEIADELGIDEDTVKRGLHFGLHHLVCRSGAVAGG